MIRLHVVSTPARSDGQCARPDPAEPTCPTRSLPRMSAPDVPTDRRYQHHHVLQRYHHPDGRILWHFKSHLVDGPGSIRQLCVHLHRHLLGGEGRPETIDARIPIRSHPVAGLFGRRIRDCRFQRLRRVGILLRQVRHVHYGAVSFHRKFFDYRSLILNSF